VRRTRWPLSAALELDNVLMRKRLQPGAAASP
jgi:hypothetical protein